MKTFIIVLTLILESVQIGISQGTFQDLDFEDATLVASGFGGLSPASAFPGWQLSIGANQVQSVVLNGGSAGGAEISLENNNPIQGNYSAVLFGGAVLPSSLEPASISQTGTIPSGTKSIQLDATYFGSPFTVTVGGTTIDMVPVDTFVHYTLWGGNIPASMAGQTETLTITEPPPPGTPPSGVELDDITFSPNPISVTPEPDAFTLISIGGALFAACRRFALKRKGP